MENLKLRGDTPRRSGTAVQWAVALALGTAYPFTSSVRAGVSAELETSVNFDIAAQSLDTALLQFSKQAGVQVLATDQSVSGKRTQGVRGAYPVGRALIELLKGSGLTYRQTSNRAVTIDTDSGKTAGQTDSDLTLAQAAQNAATDPGEAAKGDEAAAADIEEVVVRGIEFRYTEPSSATKLAMNPKDIPQSLTLVTEDVMEFASIKRFDDVYRIDASAGSTYRQDGFPTTYYRGFSNQGVNAIRIDGFRFTGSIDLDLVGFERFEVVKGPASTLYGQNTIGGTLNALTKQPKRERAASFRLEGGSFEHKRGEFDFTGPISADGRWAYRLVGAYEDSNSFQDFAGRQSKTLVPSLSFDLSERTRFLFSAYYNQQDVTNDFGQGLQEVDAANGIYRTLPVARSHFFGEPWNNTDLEATIVTLRGEHEFSDQWKLRVAFQENNLKRDWVNCSAQGNPNAEGVLPAGCYTYMRDTEDTVHGGEVNLIGDFEWLGREHTLFVGADFAQQTPQRLYAYTYIDDADHDLSYGSSIGYNVLNPVHAISRPTIDRYAFYSELKQKVQYAGISAQLLLHPVEKLSVLLAGRYNDDQIKVHEGRSGATLAQLEAKALSPTNPTLLYNAKKTVGQAGVTYAVTDETNLYVNWGQTYEPKFGRQYDAADPLGGKNLSAEEGEQFEVGVKASLFDNRLSATLAAFTMERSGISQGDREHPGFIIPLGTQRSRGIEFGAAGELAPGWEIYVSAALLDAEFIKGDFTGTHAANAPKRAISLFSSYQVQSGPAKGFGAGLGYVYKDGLATRGLVTASPTPIPYDFGSVKELDLRLFYNAKRWEAFVAGRNLLDGVSYAPAFFNEFRYGISVNPGRSVIAGITYRIF